MDKKLPPNSLQSSKNLFSLNSLADTYNHKGLKFLEKDDYENAITCFFQSLDYDENYSHAYSNIGNALLKKGNYDEAVKMFGDAIKLDEKNSDYHFNLGVALTQCNDYKGAAKAYKECLKITPRNKLAVKFLGNCYKDLRMFPEAIKPLIYLFKFDFSIASQTRSTTPFQSFSFSCLIKVVLLYHNADVISSIHLKSAL